MRLVSVSGATTNLSADALFGNCEPLDTFEHLNQLGEGSMWEDYDLEEC